MGGKCAVTSITHKVSGELHAKSVWLRHSRGFQGQM